MATLLITLVLELCSIPSAMAITRQKGGQRLYLTAVAMNFFNHLILGPPVYAIATSFFCRRELYPPLLSAGSCAGCVLVHALGYYTAHRAMHTREFYWAHRFHHRFNSHVSPVVANAVSFVEYLIAYMCACNVKQAPHGPSQYCNDLLAIGFAGLAFRWVRVILSDLKLASRSVHAFTVCPSFWRRCCSGLMALRSSQLCASSR